MQILSDKIFVEICTIKGIPICTHLSILCLKVFKLTTFPMTLGIFTALGYEFNPSLSILLISEKNSLARVDILCALYVPSLDNEYSVILVAIFCSMASKVWMGIPLTCLPEHNPGNLLKSIPVVKNWCILYKYSTHSLACKPCSSHALNQFLTMLMKFAVALCPLSCINSSTGVPKNLSAVKTFCASVWSTTTALLKMSGHSSQSSTKCSLGQYSYPFEQMCDLIFVKICE